MKKKINKNKILYVKLILEISYELGISLQESKKIIDFSILILKPIQINYEELKKEILLFLTINIFSLIYKL